LTRILEELFSATLAKQFNWSGGGSKGKRAFSTLSLKSVVIGKIKN
jgi:hypothetical protein